MLLYIYSYIYMYSHKCSLVAALKGALLQRSWMVPMDSWGVGHAEWDTVQGEVIDTQGNTHNSFPVKPINYNNNYVQ